MSLPRRYRCAVRVPAFALLQRGRTKLLLALLALATLGFAGCAQQPQQLAASHGKEYFPSSKYGPISRRVIADGQPIPHGGGQYLVGKPYTVAGQTYYPSERHITQIGNASWYGDAFHGRLTANGEIYDRNGFTAAHPTLPLPSYARVTNLRNNTSMIVRVNDRGPYASNRIMDLSGGVADALDIKRSGTARVKVEYVAPASLAGSEDAKLLATLRVNGPAQWPGEPVTTVAAAAPPVRVAALPPYDADRRGERRHPALIDADEDEARASRTSSMPHASHGARRPGAAGRREDAQRREAGRREHGENGRDVPAAEVGWRHQVPDPHAQLARLIESTQAGSRGGPIGRSRKVPFSEEPSDALRFVQGRPGRVGSDASDHTAIVAGHRTLLPPQRSLEAQPIRGGGRGWEDQHRFRQAGLRLTPAREN